jgi:hypothetical protein
MRRALKLDVPAVAALLVVWVFCNPEAFFEN